MGLHYDLEIFKTASDLLDQATELTRNIPRAFKRQFSEEIVKASIEITLLVIDANSAVNKVPHLDALLRLQKKAELLLRLFSDKRWISTKQYAAAIALTSSIGRQGGAWKTKSQNRPPQPG